MLEESENQIRKPWRILNQLKEVVWFLAIVNLLSVVTGSLVALFLWSLDKITQLHWSNPWLIFGLPVAGVLSYVLYDRISTIADRGHSLILDRVRHPNDAPDIPIAMTPLVLLGTLLTHLCGGSAGREGTAVQMGSGIASGFLKYIRPDEEWRRTLLLCGIASGFGAVFGTPVAGAMFAIEVVWLGRTSLLKLVPCLVSGFIAHQVTLWWGIEHSIFHLQSLGEFAGGNALGADTTAVPLFSFSSGAKIALASVAFGLIGWLFAASLHAFSRACRQFIKIGWLRPFIGGCLFIVMTIISGTRDYSGIGVDPNPYQSQSVSITSSFEPEGAGSLSWLGKLVATTITVGSGFKGGEVTPLFFLGATAGNAIGHWLQFPVDLMAAIGFVAVFAAATKTPIACSLLAIELFMPSNPAFVHSGFIAYVAFGCVIARFVSGNTSIYRSSSLTNRMPT